MKRPRSHRRHRRRDALRKTRTASRIARRWLRLLYDMGALEMVLFAPLALWCGVPRR